MGSDSSKPDSKPGANGPAESPHNPDGTSKSTGRVKFDERGNAIWEWQVTTGAFGPEVSDERLQRLEHQGLSIADDAPTPFDQVKANPLGTKKGYDPYDSGKLGKAKAPPRKTDLRKLSEWLKLKKQADQNKAEEPEE